MLSSLSSTIRTVFAITPKPREPLGIADGLGSSVKEALSDQKPNVAIKP
jgi:hypothetical protein